LDYFVKYLSTNINEIGAAVLSINIADRIKLRLVKDFGVIIPAFLAPH
jgi:hypothetical protein